MKEMLATLLCSGLTAAAATWYVSPAGSGSQSGADLNNCLPAWSNNAAGNWGSGPGQFHNGDTINWTGIFTNEMNVWGSVTVNLLTNSGVVTPATDLIYINPGLSVTLNGTQNSYLSNSANGTGLPLHVASKGVCCSGAANVTISNLAIMNLYVHTSQADSSIDPPRAGGVYANGITGSITVVGCTFSNIGWCINLEGEQARITIETNVFMNYDHGIGSGASGAIVLLVQSNHFGTTGNWDTTQNTYHHDGIHYFGETTNISFTYDANFFGGNWGTHNTAYIYNESSPPNGLVYNNLAVQYPGCLLNNGFFLLGGNYVHIYNNTLYGANMNLQYGLQFGGMGATATNNYIGYVNTFVSASTGIRNDYNYYGPFQGGGNSPWYWNKSGVGDLGTWNADTGGDKAGGLILKRPVLNAKYQPINEGAGYANTLIGFGANLSQIFTTDMAGNPRPATGAWTVGALLPPPTNVPGHNGNTAP